MVVRNGVSDSNSSKSAYGSTKLRIGFILSRSFTLSAFALFIDTLRLASDELDRSRRLAADWQVLASSKGFIRSSCGVQLVPTAGFGDPAEFSYIVVVGGLLKEEEPVDAETLRYLRRAAAANVPLIGLCTGTFILAEAGLMRNHECCVSWLHARDFQSRFPDHVVRSDRIFHLDERRGSCAGGSSAADMAALIVRRHISSKAERNALEVLQIDHARSPFHLQARRTLAEDADDARVRATLLTMEQHLNDCVPIAQLARLVGLSRRQLERLFREKAGMSPANAYKRVRLSHARSLIANTDASMLEIALEAGFENASHFARTFKKFHGQTPSQVRTGAMHA
jgi:transcriptional regulator GlxA family with amidase domain